MTLLTLLMYREGDALIPCVFTYDVDEAFTYAPDEAYTYEEDEEYTYDPCADD